MAFCRSLPERCGVVAVPNVVFYDDKDAGRPLVRFAFCKRLEVIDDAVRPGSRGMAAVRVAARPARHRVGGPRRELRAPRAADRRRRGRRRPPRRAHRDVLHRLLDGHRRGSPSRSTARARGSCVEQAREHGVWVCGSVPEVQPGDDAPVQHARPRRARRHDPPLPQDPPVHLRRRARALRRRRRARHRRRRRRPRAASSSATTCASPTSSGRSRPTPTATSSSPTGPRRGATTGGRCCRPGRSRTRPTSSA